MNGRLLIVDDDPIYCDGLKARFESDNPDWTVFTANSVSEAAKLIESEESFDVVLTVIDMRSADIAQESAHAEGLEIIRAATRKDRDAEVVIMTANGDLGAVHKALTLGAAQYVDKGLPESQWIIAEVVEHRMDRVREMRKVIENQKRRGRLIYEREIRVSAEPESLGKFLVLDLATGAYEIDEHTGVAVERLLRRVPDAEIYGFRIGDEETKVSGESTVVANP